MLNKVRCKKIITKSKFYVKYIFQIGGVIVIELAYFKLYSKLVSIRSVYLFIIC